MGTTTVAESGSLVDLLLSQVLHVNACLMLSNRHVTTQLSCRIRESDEAAAESCLQPGPKSIDVLHMTCVT